MTESEWNACADPQPMLKFLRSQASGRKVRLFACGCCRRYWHLLDEAGRHAVEATEAWVDGALDQEALRRAWLAAATAGYWVDAPTSPEPYAAYGAACAAYRGFDPCTHEVDIPLWQVRRDRDAAYWAGVTAFFFTDSPTFWTPTGTPHREAESGAQARLLRDIVGNPFRPLGQPPLTREVLQVAQAVYDERRFDELPILADALEDAGCDNEDILGHCRGPGPHALGCWPLDLVLGKS